MIKEHGKPGTVTWQPEKATALLHLKQVDRARHQAPFPEHFQGRSPSAAHSKSVEYDSSTARRSFRVEMRANRVLDEGVKAALASDTAELMTDRRQLWGAGQSIIYASCLHCMSGAIAER